MFTVEEIKIKYRFFFKKKKKFTFRLEVAMELRAGETGRQLSQESSCLASLRMIIRTHVHICNPGTGEVEVGSSLGLAS